MSANHHIWRVWADTLHRWGLNNIVSSFLEAAGPLTLMGAQAVYLTQPLLSGILPAAHMQAMVEMLEDSDQTRSFVDYLRERTAL